MPQETDEQDHVPAEPTAETEDEPSWMTYTPDCSYSLLMEVPCSECGISRTQEIDLSRDEFLFLKEQLINRRKGGNRS